MEHLQIENKAARLKLSDTVHKGSMDKLIDEIGKVFGAKAFESGLVTGEITNCIENAADTLDIEIHSPGGSVLDGYTLYNELLDARNRGVYVTAYVTLAASMASVIAMAADKVVFMKGGRMMIHEASAVTQGDADDHKQRAELLESMSDEIAGIYADRSGKYGKEEMRKLMKVETWLNADDAIELGLADAKFDTKKKDKAMNIIERLTNPSNEEAIEQISSLEAQISNHDAQVAEFQAKLDEAESALQAATTELLELKSAKESAENKIAELEAQIEEASKQVEATIEEQEAVVSAQAEIVQELEEAAKETEEKVSAKAAELLAQQGHPAPVAINDEEAQSEDSIKAQFAKMKPGAERTAFFNAHKDVLSILS